VLAAANNHLECVKELLKNGADPAARRLVSSACYKHIHYEYLCFAELNSRVLNCEII